jgi:hypothetical protein
MAHFEARRAGRASDLKQFHNEPQKVPQNGCSAVYPARFDGAMADSSTLSAELISAKRLQTIISRAETAKIHLRAA